MAETLGSLKRTHYCGVLTEGDIGARVCVMGWVQRRRDLGSLLFIDLRDRTGLVQLAFDEQSDPAVRGKGVSCRSEYVVAAVGTVRKELNTRAALGMVAFQTGFAWTIAFLVYRAGLLLGL